MKFGQLRVTTVDGRTREYPIDLPALVVGRADGSSIVIDDLSVARRHARLIVDSGRLLVEDLGSASGTFISGRRIPSNTPSLVEDEQDIRFGDVTVRYQAPPSAAPEHAPAGPAADDALPEDEDASGLAPTIRATLSVPPQPIEAGAAPAVAYLAVQNRGRVVDELDIRVQDLPADWVRISQPRLILLPGEQSEVTLIIQPPRRYESHAGHYDFAVVVNSTETGHEVLTNGQLEVLAFEATTLTLHPVRSKRRFTLVAENTGNDRALYRLTATDDEEAFLYAFEQPTVELEPGQQKSVPFRVQRKKRKWLGPTISSPFSVIATPVDAKEGQKATAVGQFTVRPALQPFVKPAALALIAVIALVAIYLYFFWPNNKTVTTANAEAAYAGVHMCDKPADERPAVPTGAAAASAAPLFAQIDPAWANDQYAKAGDPDFGPDWCGTTIAQCGCAMTSVATVMALFQDLTMPDGTQLDPKTLNDWFNLQARKTDKGWVSQGYVYGDVVWTAANQLSGEIAKVKPDARKIRFSRIGTGSDEEVKSELKAGRPVILEVPGHWIAAVGLQGDKILINDPYYRDRKTLDAYEGKVKSSVLFEPSDDLSAVVISAPSNVRVRVTDKEGRVVGTLNTGTPDDAKKEAQTGIPGSSYSYRAAWRDPSCVESPPPPGAGTNQIILPGSKDDYKIEAVDAGGGPTSVAIHTYDHDGIVSVQTQDNPGPAVLAVSYDPAQANTTVSLVPNAVPSPDAQPSPAPGSNGVPAGGTGTPKAGSVTPTASKTPTVNPTSTPTLVPTPAPPTNVQVACTVQYAQSPKTATVNCNGTVDGTFTSASWTVNGIPIASGNGKSTFSTTFQSDTTAQVSMSACNQGACRTGSNSVKVQFPSASATPATPTPTPGSGTPTPIPTPPVSNPSVSCAADGPDNALNISCSTSFNGTYNSIAWDSPGGNPPDAASGSKSYSFGATWDRESHVFTMDSLGSHSRSTSSWAGGFDPDQQRAAAQAAFDAAFGVGRITVSGTVLDPDSNPSDGHIPPRFTITFTVSANICNGSACTLQSATVFLSLASWPVVGGP